MRFTHRLPIKFFYSISLVLLVISTNFCIARPAKETGMLVAHKGKSFGQPSDSRSQFERRARLPIILPIPLYWGIDWNFLWFFVDPDRVSSAMLGISPENYQTITNSQVATMRQGALQAATQAVEVYYLVHPEAAVSALAEIRRLAILESESDLPEDAKEEERRLKASLWEFFQQNPSLKANTAAIFLANVPDRDKAGLETFEKPSESSDEEHDSNSSSNSTDTSSNQNDVQEPVVKDWAHVNFRDSETPKK
ncbi:hypothetical protein CROQUDRAFT_107063 [Cronartium quercuum f. sp. fusiforme G11]|uniref:DUF5667 domain-containing protein n=1 Tax=Cronartium quercuum f. sp. fusiforme G11 TaxID=708437 RepID=A0A9P6TCE1_9BASI|nr:hypothetical protein CROQUDRAFT_107063 [Cronartium quercuum f. sp. fusiforme G11]